MVTMSRIWDRTTAVLGGRAGILAGIAFVALFLPAAVRAALPLLGPPTSPALGAAAVAIGFAVLIAAVWGQLAMIAVASDPAVGRAEAGAEARARLLPAIGVILVAVLAVVLLATPLAAMLIRSGIDWQAMAAANDGAALGAKLPASLGGAIALYLVIVGIAALFVGVRLALLYPVILHERVGLGAFGRSWRLTRGLTWRLIGVALLYVVVLFVASSAAKFVVGIVAGLVLGAQSPAAAFLAAVAGLAVSVTFAVLAAVFTAQLYVALRDGAAAA